MRILFYFLLSLMFFKNVSKAQTKTGKGLYFEHNLSWKNILIKARKENKYIFIDCYTTWCGPCKLMEKEIYPEQEVGSYFNEHFVSVKVQMDKTDKDNKSVMNWYSDAEMLKNIYGIPEFPTYLFLSSEGKLVARDKGYKNVKTFLEVASKSIELTQAPYIKYYEMLSDYEAGRKNYVTMPALIDTAKLVGQLEQEKIISLDYKNHLLLLNEKELYSKANISFLSSHLTKSLDPLFHLFYPKENIIDSIMGVHGYAAFVIDKIIQLEEINPFLSKIQDSLHGWESTQSNKDPDWENLRNIIENKYSKNYGERNVLKTQVKWYQDHHEWSKCSIWLTVLEKKYIMDSNNAEADMNLMFTIWWTIFDRSVDKEQIDMSIETMKGIVRRVSDRGDALSSFLDTYANLLYKAGRIEEAMQEENAALDEAIKGRQSENDLKEYKETLNKIRLGIPTWPRYIDKDDILGNGLI